MTISDNVIGEFEKFKYLRSFVQKDRDFMGYVNYRIK